MDELNCILYKLEEENNELQDASEEIIQHVYSRETDENYEREVEI